MPDTTFKAFIVEETEDKTYAGSIQQARTDDLPQGEILVRVLFSSLNYKDALSATGNKGVTRKYPHTPGIDAAGIVAESSHPDFKTGDQVIVTSYDLGMNTPGGFGQYIRVPAGWVVPLPAGLTLEQSMIYGTAGFTAGMSVEKIVAGVKPDAGPVLVTGATGGVGSMAVAILNKLGYEVAAVSGKPDTAFLKGLGVTQVISRKTFLENTKPPMLKTRWSGVIDTVGGDILATAIKSADAWGIVTCCGLVASPDLPINVFPFILRGVTLCGIDSQSYPAGPRQRIWANLASEWRPGALEDMAVRISLDGLDEAIAKILKGGITGRTVVDLRD